MKHKIFFSWQSDLPNNTNRSFIEDCLKKAIKNIKDEKLYLLDLNIDRDTQNICGAPDIADSIFSKISQATFFVADVSFINNNSKSSKKTPNPNVLLELGYAVNRLGWERVICIFNQDYGNVTELPFDLRNRRMLVYKTSTEKELEKKKLVSIFKSILEENYQKALFSNELMDYYNSDIYLLLFRLIMDIAKTIIGFDEYQSNLHTITKILSHTHEDIRNALSQKAVLGFQIFKSYSNYTIELCNMLEKIVPIKNFEDDYYVPIVRLINTLRLYNKALNRQKHWDKLKNIKNRSSEYVIGGNNSDKDEKRLMLLRKLDSSKSVVIDFGDFQRKDHIENLLNEFLFDEYTLNFYSGFYYNLIKEIVTWIEKNGGEFIVDETQLEIY